MKQMLKKQISTTIYVATWGSSDWRHIQTCTHNHDFSLNAPCVRTKKIKSGLCFCGFYQYIQWVTVGFQMMFTLSYRDSNRLLNKFWASSNKYKVIGKRSEPTKNLIQYSSLTKSDMEKKSLFECNASCLSNLTVQPTSTAMLQP